MTQQPLLGPPTSIQSGERRWSQKEVGISSQKEWGREDGVLPPTSKGLMRQRGLVCHGGGNPVTGSPKATAQRDPHLFGALDPLSTK